MDPTARSPNDMAPNPCQTNQGEAMTDAYHQWLVAEIRGALDDPLPSVAHEEVMATMDAEIEAIEFQRGSASRSVGT